MARPKAAPSPPAEEWRLLRWNIRQLAYRERLAQGVTMTLLRLPAGTFWMGAPEGEKGSSARERPVHRVTLGEFLLGQTPVTQAQWRAVAQWHREEQEDREVWPEVLEPDPVSKLAEADRFRGDKRPVVNVSWRQAMAFCQRLRLRTGKNYTLPSEAQWEYACRAGTTTPFHFGESISPELVNYNCTFFAYADGPKGKFRNETTDVDTFPGNAWGLRDMHGNVWEWCADHWHENYEGAPEDGRPWLKEKAGEDAWRLLRGGSWFNVPRICRAAYCDWDLPANRDSVRGFRVCCLPRI